MKYEKRLQFVFFNKRNGPLFVSPKKKKKKRKKEHTKKKNKKKNCPVKTPANF